MGRIDPFSVFNSFHDFSKSISYVDEQVHHTMGNETADLTFRLGSYLVVNSIWVKLVISYCENRFAFE